MTRLDVRALAQAAGVVSAVIFSLCALWIAVSPRGFMATIGYMLHIDLTPLARNVTFASYLTGVICVGLFAAVTTGALGLLYNRLARPSAIERDMAPPVTITRETGVEHPIR